MSDHLSYLYRALDLAKLAGRNVRPNPQVGAVIVYDGKIIGEGYHQYFGGPHAEVNAVNNVPQDMVQYLSSATLYVTLEPCSFHGKTPPCVDLIIKHQIPKVIIGTTDPNARVSGNGVKALRENRVDVTLVDNAFPYRWLIREFMVNQKEKRPFIMLKMAKSKDNFIGHLNQTTKISNTYSDFNSHRWRGHTDAILIGTNTAMVDNPKLTTRYGWSNDAMRVVLDKNGILPPDHFLLSDANETIIVTNIEPYASAKTVWNMDFESPEFLLKLLERLFLNGIYHLTVEGGSKIQQSFINAGLWDEAMTVTSNQNLKEGIASPFFEGMITESIIVDGDRIVHVANTKSKCFVEDDIHVELR